MREAREVRRHFGPEGEKVPDLPVFASLCLGSFDHVEMRAWAAAGFDVCKIDGRDGR